MIDRRQEKATAEKTELENMPGNNTTKTCGAGAVKGVTPNCPAPLFSSPYFLGMAGVSREERRRSRERQEKRELLLVEIKKLEIQERIASRVTGAVEVKSVAESRVRLEAVASRYL